MTPLVMPAKAGIQMGRTLKMKSWIPAFAGMTQDLRAGRRKAVLKGKSWNPGLRRDDVMRAAPA